MPNNAPHNELRKAVNRAIANGSPIITEIPAFQEIELADMDAWESFVEANPFDRRNRESRAPSARRSFAKAKAGRNRRRARRAAIARKTAFLAS